MGVTRCGDCGPQDYSGSWTVAQMRVGCWIPARCLLPTQGSAKRPGQSEPCPASGLALPEPRGPPKCRGPAGAGPLRSPRLAPGPPSATRLPRVCPAQPLVLKGVEVTAPLWVWGMEPQTKVTQPRRTVTLCAGSWKSPIYVNGSLSHPQDHPTLGKKARDPTTRRMSRPASGPV